ncbi:MAG: SAM-dependent methyltransferase [Bowdeniella nasicola]|nr:SAM-dependent methyltransferase [Bowdeniella nasicola]
MSSAAHLAGFKALLTPAGQALLADLPEVHSPTDVLRLSERLRADGWEPAVIAAALTQVKLRRRARAKFGPFAADLLYSDTGLQQATPLAVAAHHARRFQTAGCTHVADLGCGIGSESLALAGLDIAVSAVDHDELHAALALVNLRRFSRVTVAHQDLFSFDFSRVDGAFADPARRDARGRQLDPNRWHPPLKAILGLRERVANLGVKVAPGIHYEHLPIDAHVQWVSLGGNLIEAGIWCGALAAEGPGRSALLLDDGASVSYDAQVADPRADPIEVPVCDELGSYLAMVDPAILRAGALATVAQQLEATLVSESISYLTCTRRPHLPGVRAFAIEAQVSANAKKLQKELTARNVGSVEIFSRGSGIVPDTLRRRLRLRGERHLVVVLTRVRGKHVALLATDVDSPREVSPDTSQ